MVSRAILITALAASIVAGAAASAVTWTMARRQSCEALAPAAQAGGSEAEKARRAQDFFGTPRQYDTKNGQEMRPRW